MTAAREWWHAPAKASPRRLASRLTSSLGLTGASAVTVERTYLDTFDWRLFRRGDALVEEKPEGGRRVLVLQNRAGERPELRVPCTGRPRQPTELPVGLQRRLGPKLAPRTLLDVGRERVEVWPLRLLDEADKTVAYVDVERAPGAVRVGLRPVRGYEKTADQLVALLNSQADLVSGIDPMVAAVRANGREPGELPEPPELKLKPGEDARAALAKIFDHLLTTMVLNEDGVRQQLDPELLHDFRVATRRTRSIERLARPYLPSEMGRLWEQEWTWLAGVTGLPRDLDVLLLELQLDRPTITASADSGMHELESRVRARRATEQAKLLDALDGDRYATLKRGWRVGINDLLAASNGATRANGDANVNITASQLARETISTATKHLMKAAKKIDDRAPAEDIHTARKRAKRLRYAAEMLGGALPPKDVKSVISHMKRMQDDLGQFQDSEVQLHLVRDLLGDPSLGEPSSHALAVGELMMQDLVERQEAARGDLVKALREFAALMKVIATYSIKGGVGKTAAAVNLAYLAAREGEPSLLWDLDPQGAATFLLRVRPKVKGGARAIVRRKRPIYSSIKSTDFANFDLVPADLSYRHLDLALDRTKKPHEQLADLLQPLADEYSYVFLDCAPSMSLVSESIFGAADVLLVPTIPTTLSVRTLEQLRDFLGGAPKGAKGAKALSNGSPRVLTFFSLADRRKRLHRDVIEALSAQPDVLEAAVPSATDVEQMGKHRAPVAEFAPSSRAARSYEDLWSALRKATE